MPIHTGIGIKLDCVGGGGEAPSFIAFSEDANGIVKAIVKATDETFSFSGAAGRTVTDFESVVWDIEENELAHEGARRIENLFFGSSEDITAAAWSTNAGATVLGPNEFSYTAENNGLLFQARALSGRTFAISAKVKNIPGTEQFRLRLGSSSNLSPDITVTTEYKRYGRVAVADGTSTSFQNASDAQARTLQIDELQVHDVTDATNQSIGDYVSVGVETDPQFHGAGVDRVKYFAYEDASTIGSNNEVTEAQGAVITGYRTRFTPTVDNADGIFAFSNFDITQGSFVFDLTMDAALTQGVINFANAAAGVCSYQATAGRFETTDGTNTAFVDPSLSTNLGDTIRFSVLYSVANGLRIGYRNITDGGAWVWGAPASFNGAFASNSVFNVFFGLAASSTMRDLLYWGADQEEAFIEGNY